MIITDVLIHQLLQMTFVEHDNMIEQISSANCQPNARYTVLPRTSKAGPPGLNVETLHRPDDFFIEVRGAIKDQVSGFRVVRRRLAQPLRDPRTSWMLRNAKVENTPPVMGQ